MPHSLLRLSMALACAAALARSIENLGSAAFVFESWRIRSSLSCCSSSTTSPAANPLAAAV